MSDNYDVGYGKPPEQTQFRKGRSGNPAGRPKGTKNLKTDVMEEMREKVVIREGERPRKISKQRAVVKTLVARTLKGDARAAKILIDMISQIVDPDGETAIPSPPLNAEEREALELLKKRLSADATAEPPATGRPDSADSEP